MMTNKNLEQRISALENENTEQEKEIRLLRIHCVDGNGSGQCPLTTFDTIIRSLPNAEERRLVLDAAEKSYGHRNPFEVLEEEAKKNAHWEMATIKFPTEKEKVAEGYRFLSCLLAAFDQFDFTVSPLPACELEKIEAAALAQI